MKLVSRGPGTAEPSTNVVPPTGHVTGPANEGQRAEAAANPPGSDVTTTRAGGGGCKLERGEVAKSEGRPLPAGGVFTAVNDVLDLPLHVRLIEHNKISRKQH